jgi:hypothetical protein
LSPSRLALCESEPYGGFADAWLESLNAGEVLALPLRARVGKTFLVHAALAHRDLQHLKVVHLWYPTCSFHDTFR